MILPTAAPPADTARLREQIVTAREALTAAVASLDGAMEAAQDRDSNYPVAKRHLYASVDRLIASLSDARAATSSALNWLVAVELTLEQQRTLPNSGGR